VILFGLLDILVFGLAVIAFILVRIVDDLQESMNYGWTTFLILFYFPQVIFFALFMFNDSLQTRKIYSYFLILRSLIQSVVLPIVVFRSYNVFLKESVCGTLYNDYEDLVKGVNNSLAIQPEANYLNSWNNSMDSTQLSILD
jgi:hypothetical protein